MDPGPTLYLSEMFGDGPTTSESSASVSTSKPRLPGTPGGLANVGLKPQGNTVDGSFEIRLPLTS